jgi:hypothetical protein
MATYTYDTPTRTLTAVFSAPENKILKAAAADAGTNVLGNLIDTYIAQQATVYGARDKDLIREALRTATQAQIDAVKTALGL